MDIATRIKMFLDSTGIQSSQFADTCGIPRPSLSQLLNGRNKKVSDDVIRRIHDAYPNLSVLWLMFGEGEMVKDGNIEISEPENRDFTPTLLGKDADPEEIINEIPEFPIVNKIEENRKPVEPSHVSRSLFDEIPSTKPAYQSKNGVTERPSVSLKVDSTRKVVNIMVFYSDNSFETFVPKGA